MGALSMSSVVTDVDVMCDGLLEDDDSGYTAQATRESVDAVCFS